MTRRFVVAALAASFLMSAALRGHAAEQAASPRAAAAPSAVDVRLHDGLLLAQVVNGQNVPHAQTDVHLFQQGKLAATAKTDDKGWVRFENIRGGAYLVETQGSGAMVRVWTPQAAPPTASEAALIITDETVARGRVGRALRNVVTNPWFIGGAVATAVIVPIALDENDPPPRRTGS